MTSHSVVTAPRHLAGVVVAKCAPTDRRGLIVKEGTQAMLAVAHLEYRDEISVVAELLGR